MHLTVLTVIASAAVVAATPIRRDDFNPADYPDCPAAIIALLPGCIANPSNNCFANAPQFPAKCLEEIKKVHPALPGLPSAATPAGPPHRRQAFDASKFPDCPPAIISLLSGCVANPSNNCFANPPQFSAKCLDEIKQVYPALPGLPAAVETRHRRAAFNAADFPDCPPPIIALLPGCIDNPSNTCFASAPEFPQKCLEEIKKVHPALPGLPSAAATTPPAAAAPASPNTGATTPPHRRGTFNPADFPDCPPAIIALLPGCIESPSETCFANAPQFPQKCLEEIKKVHPALPGLPSAAAATVPAAAAPASPNTGAAAPPHRRQAFDASKFPDCPAAIITLLRGCVATPSNTCFNKAPQFPAKCLEEIKKVYPSLPGLPSGN